MPGCTVKQDEQPTCFLCPGEGRLSCPHCSNVSCGQQHASLHRRGGYCFPFKVGYIEGKGRVLFATRDIKPLEIVLVDPGSLVGPNYRSAKVCLDCLKELESLFVRCPSCKFPLCGDQCVKGKVHSAECGILSRNTNRAVDDDTLTYAHVTVLRLLLLSQSGSDAWSRTNQLMDHLEEREVHPEEWDWYKDNIINYIQQDLRLADTFTVQDIERAIGLLNVNAVCLQFPKVKGTPLRELGKGIYPIFAIMSHECICNTRYVIDPKTFNMYVRSRVSIKAGEELTVQYLSALWGNLKRRKIIRSEWYFDCACVRCADRTECGSNISSVKCFECNAGNLMPRDSLDYDSVWFCSKCNSEIAAERIEALVKDIELEFDGVLETEEFWRYRELLEKYSGTFLHPNHWILTTARRNLIQYMCYGDPTRIFPPVDHVEKFKLCQDFFTTLKKVDPGWSDLSMFAAREFHYAKLSLLEREFAVGRVQMDEFSVKSRNSIDALDRINKDKEFLVFDDERDRLDG